MILVIETNAQEKSTLPDSIPLNPLVRQGVLENGLTYYILRKKNAKNKIALRLVEKAGSYHCKEGEEGAAHFIEHLSFRSTEHFPEGMLTYMIGLGLSDADVSAKTGPNTYYELRIPGGDSVLLRYGLMALHNCAKGRLFLPDDVESERAAVLNEFATADARRIQGAYLLLGKNPLYDPGKVAEEVQNYKTMSMQTLRSFDRKWYRPDLQALIIVGDVDENDMEKKVKALFSTLKSEMKDNAPSADIYKQYEVPLTGSNKMVVVNDGSNRTNIHIEILQKRKTVMGMAGPSTVSQLKTKLIDDLYNELVRQRLNKVKLPNLTLLIHWVDRRAIHPFAGIDALTTWIDVNGLTGVKEAITGAMTALHQIEKWGFTNNEFVLAKEAVLKKIEGDLQDPRPELVARALTDYFVDQAAFPGNALELNTQLLNNILLNQINSLAKEWIMEDKNTDLLLAVANENDPAIPGKEQVFSWIKTAMNSTAAPYTEKPLKSLPPSPADINRNFTRTELSEIGATQLLLSNGAKVVIKRLGSVAENPWPELGDIAVNGFRAGGTNLYSHKDYLSASIAGDLIRTSGVALLNDTELKDWLKDKNRKGELSVGPYISAEEEGIAGHSALHNIEDFFHLVYLYFTAPRKDEAVFSQRFKFGLEKAAKTRSGIELFNNSIQNIVSGNVVRKATGTPEFNKALRIYHERFSTARDFTFMITGYFEAEDIIKQAGRYLGALPGATTNTGLSNHKIKTQVYTQLPVTNKDLRVTLIGDSTGEVDVKMLCAGGKLDGTIRNQLLTSLAGEVLNPLLFQRLREQEKGVYWVTSNGVIGYNNKFFVNVNFATAPENVDRLSVAVMDELNKIAKGNLDDSAFVSALEIVRSRVSNDLIDANYVNDYLKGQLRIGTQSLDGLKRNEILNQLNKHDVINLIRDSLDRKHYMLFKLL